MVEVLSGLRLIAHRGANMYLLDHNGALTLIDTGFPGSGDAVLAEVAAIGRQPGDITDIILTHAHFDHIGSAADLVARTGARTWIHAADAAIAEGHEDFRPITPSPELLPSILARLFSKPGRRVDPVAIDKQVQDGDTIPLAGGLRVVGTPGHCAGQIALLWSGRGVLFAADACMNLIGLGDPVGFEDMALGKASQRKLAALDFQTACFGHGKPIKVNAAQRFRRKWGA
jgi:glyoxylase-like metal-dependent hydrolase (beta-lactamase superfamily II)